MISKIAIFRALHLGDMLCIIPTVRAIRAAWPEAEIFLIGLPWQADFTRRFPRYFNHFIEFPGWPGLPEQAADPERILRFLHDIRSFQFDIIFQLQGNGEITNSLCMLWGAKRVCGLRKPGEYAPNKAMFPVSEDSEHEVTRFFKILQAMNIKPKGAHLEFPLTPEEHDRGRALIKEAGLAPHKFVCIHPGARDPRRRWPVDSFAFIANEVVSMDIPVVLTGSGDERTLLEEVQNLTDGRLINVVDAFGHLSAGELGAMLKYARLLVSNDTGVSHLASALGTPSVIVFSPASDFNRWRPLDSRRNAAIPYSEARSPLYVMDKVRTMLSSQESDSCPAQAPGRETPHDITISSPTD